MGKRNSNAAAGNVTLRFDGQPHHTFEIGRQAVKGGGTFTVDAATAKQLLGWADVSVVDGDGPQWPATSDELDALAAKLEVELPTVPDGGGVEPPTVNDKIAALEAAGYTPETAAAEAAGGEGSTTPGSTPGAKQKDGE